jgi:spermidine synthase
MPKRALLYAAAIFLSSSLLFLVEPMAAKRVLPLLGGSAAVWITCLVFFQTALLLGYLCAHGIATRVSRRMQAIVYGLLLLVSLAQVAMNLDPHPHASMARPIFSVLAILSGLIGLPFLVLSATNPLLQAWYARSAGLAGNNAETIEAQRPPYRLFALSNFGSLLGLVIYPVVVEPYFSLHAQTLAWSIGFLLFALVCGAISIGGSTALPEATPDPAANQVSDGGETAPGPHERTMWLLMAACGALLLSAVTSHLSQNIAAIPLLWIVPLTVYLLTFVIAFNGKLYHGWLIVRLTPIALGSVGYLIADPDYDVPIKISVPLYCITLFIACLFCHGELYRRRPAPRYTTQYYLLIAAGGALGSMFVGVLAPVIFHGNFEMAWALVYTAALACALMWKEHWGWRFFWLAVTAAMLVVVVRQVHKYGQDAIVQSRSFYGTLRVLQQTTDEGEMYRTLVHGTIQHGTQYYGSDDDRTSPTTYYVHDSGIGLALDFCCGDRPRRAGFIGLGAGTLAAYGKPGDVFRFYEIDPEVEVIARNVFTYLRESKAKIEIVHGDARLSMEAEPSQQYDVIAVDAFSGDAIPVHLLTAEAIRLYQRHLRPGGILAFHISNNYLDLAPVVEAEAEHAGIPAMMVSSPDDEYTGAYAADWVLFSTDPEFFSQQNVSEAAAPVERRSSLRFWTDDYSSLWPVLKWKTPQKEE